MTTRDLEELELPIKEMKIAGMRISRLSHVDWDKIEKLPEVGNPVVFKFSEYHFFRCNAEKSEIINHIDFLVGEWNGGE